MAVVCGSRAHLERDSIAQVKTLWQWSEGI